MRTWIQAYLNRLEEDRAVSVSTRLSYGRDLRDFAEAMERMDVHVPRALLSSHVQAYLHRLRQEGKSAATIARRLVSVRALCRFGVIERILERDPTLQLDAPKPERKAPRTLSAEEVGRLLEAPDEDTVQGLRDRAMLELLYASGMRVSELMALDVGHVRPDMGFLHCSGPGSRERIVPIGGAAVRLLKRYLEEGRGRLLRPDKPTDALFPNHLGTRMTRQGFWKVIKKYAGTAGIAAELTPHALRQSFAVHLLGNGADIRAVQEMLGHASPQTTQRYQTSPKARVKEEYDRAHPRAR
ncbi:tyrosine recombinase [Cohnella sp. CFH 77786]|uniref:tyrosine recombinase n=1 Tax=Cohnella sp. CFH 77786 TaxID=2662265 RepID=UPI001C60ABF3|nr:tyrosine recombinase [Cohnella sp. CFH 77786]MBW5446714.1 tyrosine recombinase [Cohnella sp. CFH 77786]